ncbi:MAG: phage tail assembly protein [Campylobacterota bacterium]|nr:phage tail assembly protein [Campylobacterota bacterium]
MFKTEFEFVLPKGYVDKEGNLHKKGVMRLATAKDEIAPLQDHRVRNNESYMIIILLARVIEQLGDLKNIDTGTIEKLFSVDLDYLQRFYQKINSEESTDVNITCPHCETKFTMSLNEVLYVE